MPETTPLSVVCRPGLQKVGWLGMCETFFFFFFFFFLKKIFFTFWFERESLIPCNFGFAGY